MRQAAAFMKLFLLLTVVAVGLAGCLRAFPIYNVENRPFQAPSQSISLEGVRDAIIAAASQANWTILGDEKGSIIAEQRWRTHAAVVRIDYTASDFSINYHDSQNLLVGRGPEGTVHRQYNNRVRSLERVIAAALQGRTG